jgi:serine/threonine protein kinase
VALKLIAAERTRDPVFRARFEQESRLAAAIEHPHVIPVYEAGEDDGLLFIAMRLVDGPDLAAVLAAEGALEPRRAGHLTAQLGAALDAAHAHGLVHRDVKPANALLTRDDPEHLYLTDFGVAKTIGAGPAVTAAGGWVGTLDYLAPEQIRGEEVGPAVDVYALAGVLHHCLTGEVPFPRSDDAARLWAHMNAPPPSPSSLRPGIPVEVDAVIARGMAKDPAERYESAAALAAAALAALAVGAAELPLARPEGRRSGSEGGAEPTVASE